MTKKELRQAIQEVCENYNIIVEGISDNGCHLFTDNATGIKLILEYSEVKTYRFYFLVRTYDVVYHGDRTDAHVILCLLFSSFLRSYGKGMSCYMFDIGHPVVSDEIWGRYITPEQSNYDIPTDWEGIKTSCTHLIELLSFWRYLLWNSLGCQCEDCRKKRGEVEDLLGYELPFSFSKTIKNLGIESDWINHNNRLSPQWSFYYDMDREITIIKSKQIADLLILISKKVTEVSGVNGNLIIDGAIKNFVEKITTEELHDLLWELNGAPIKEYARHVMENMVVAASGAFVIALGRLGGIGEFKNEREEVRKRHNQESEILFPISIFEWGKNIPPGRFEDLIKALLEKEPNVLNVRKPSPTNQGDKGRDLLIEWNIVNKHVTTEGDPPRYSINVVGQCKVSSGTVGKSKVSDIRDTIETHNSAGFFLAVTTQITAPLTEKLESLKAKGIWTEWWNRDEIETRLSKHPELLAKFSDIVQAKDQVKFYEK